MFKTYLRKIFLCYIILTSSSLLPASTTFENSLEWQQLKSPQFNIYYLANNSKIATIILNTLQEFYPRLTAELGYQLNAPAYVFLCNTQSSYDYIVGRNFPRWSEGVALPADNVIIIKTNNLQSDPNKTVVHELTHLLLNGAVKGKPVPRWFNEGLAVYYSNEKEFASSSLISKALLTNSIIPLDEIDKVLTFRTSKAQLAYQESYSAVLFLIETYGLNSVKKLIAAFADGKDMDQAFLQAIGIDAWDFEFQWIKYIKHKYRWHWLVEFESYLWVFILLLFIIGFLLIKRRNKKIIERWDDEENYYGQEYDDET